MTCRQDRSSMSGDEDSTLNIVESPLTETVPDKRLVPHMFYTVRLSPVKLLYTTHEK